MDVFASNIALPNKQEIIDSFLLSHNINTTFTSPETLIYILIFWLLVLPYVCLQLTTDEGRRWLDQEGVEGHEAFAEIVPLIASCGMAFLVAYYMGGIGWAGNSCFWIE
jgi:hypothetical protein